ncbi:hypothetical protein SAMN06295998_11294 [Primorskyibacter flagellatus]|uniref:Secreted protein n=1 Tax=Primorskyibacter flagellatus TaxID=1387277 RepID=A0A1W2DCU6_9RHOB|nr:hypothetical protein SAMN06295998_11294 [Primorskyibacter flagellatus]
MRSPTRTSIIHASAVATVLLTGSCAFLAPPPPASATAVPGDIKESASSVVRCRTTGPGTISFSVIGDGLVSNAGPVSVATPNLSAQTTYRPTRNTGTSRDVLVSCMFQPAGGGPVVTTDAKVIIRETLMPDVQTFTVPAAASVRSAFDIVVDVEDRRLVGAGFVGRTSGIDMVGVAASGDVRIVPMADKDYGGVFPGPPTNAIGPLNPPPHIFTGECIRAGSGAVRLHVKDAAGNVVTPVPVKMIECSP